MTGDFHDAYYGLCLLFGSNSFRAGDMARSMVASPGWRYVTNQIGPARPGAIEAQLATANPGNHLVGLRSAVDAPTAVQA